VEGPGYSIWIILILVMLLFVVLWGAIVFFLGFGTWLIARIGLPSDDPRPPRRDDVYPEPRDPAPRSDH
jgi:hypothetical protein